MILMDVNILVYAHREDTGNHPAYRDWVEETINGGGAYGVSELVSSLDYATATLAKPNRMVAG
jgi:predicted nucleic acid-binding protein